MTGPRAPLRPAVDEATVGILPSAARAILGRELRSYAHLLRSGLPGVGRKRATLRRLGDLAGSRATVETAISQLGETGRPSGRPAAPDR